MEEPQNRPWVWRCGKNSPQLRTEYVGYRGFGRGRASGPEYQGRHGYLFHFELEDHPDLLGPQVEWATWTNLGDLIWARDGAVYHASQLELRNGRAPRRYDFETLVAPTSPVEIR
jgi:hypothetical protein